MASENTPLIGVENSPMTTDCASSSSKTLSTLLGSIQLILLICFYFGATIDDSYYSHAEYVIFRDIMVMLLLGFGFLMTFLRKYGLGAVGLTMMLTAISVQLNVFVELLVRFLYSGGDSDADDTVWPLLITIPTLIDGEFSAATLLISFGAVIGRASPVQLTVMALCQSLFYAFNKVVIVLGFVAAEDVGGTMAIHMFGAIFGLAVSKAMGPAKTSTISNSDPNAVSDIMALIGTTLLWVYWPSFVGATETAVSTNENACVLYTILALLGSTGAAFFWSQKLCHGKFDPVHIANSTLAGGVAVGSSARLAITPGGALLVGVLAGTVSVYGYVYSSAYLEETYNIFESSADSPVSCSWRWMTDPSFWRTTLSRSASASLSVWYLPSSWLPSPKYVTGVVMMKTSNDSPDEYDDGVWWEGEYFDKAE